MSRVLVLGLSGQVGEALRPALCARFGEIDAVSREARAPEPGVRWLQGSLAAMPVEAATGHDLILSVGPLDCFAEWFEVAAPRPTRVVALGSTGRHDKLQSPDPSERELAARLVAAETRLFESGFRQGAAVTVLRPTLLYGANRDHSLAPLVRIARRWHCLPMPANARGLRQPVHVQDVAAAVMACLDAPATAGRAYDLPGSETIPFDVMVRRTIGRHAPNTWMPRVPVGVVSVLVGLWRRIGHAGPSAGSLARLSRDQISDATAAQTDFGYAPGPFRP